jgi:hypothetical protein
MNVIAYDGQIEAEEGDWIDDGDFDDDDLDTCGHCSTELSESYCSVCGEMIGY